jgi:hypothetical protein
MQKQQQDMAEMSRNVLALRTKTNALQQALDEAAPRLPDEESEQPPRAPARPAGEGGSSAGTGVRDNARGGASISSSGGGGGSEDILARLAGMIESLRTPNPPSALAEERARLNSAIEKAEEEVRAQEEELERAQLKAATLRSKGAGGRGRDCDVECLGASSSAEPGHKRPVPQAARPTAAAAAAAAAARDNAAMSATNAEFNADDTTGQGTHPESTLVETYETYYTQELLAAEGQRFYWLDSKVKARENVKSMKAIDTNLGLLKALGRRLVAMEGHVGAAAVADLEHAVALTRRMVADHKDRKTLLTGRALMISNGDDCTDPAAYTTAVEKRWMVDSKSPDTLINAIEEVQRSAMLKTLLRTAAPTQYKKAATAGAGSGSSSSGGPPPPASSGGKGGKGGKGKGKKPGGAGAGSASGE